MDTMFALDRLRLCPISEIWMISDTPSFSISNFFISNKASKTSKLSNLKASKFELSNTIHNYWGLHRIHSIHIIYIRVNRNNALVSLN